MRRDGRPEGKQKIVSFWAELCPAAGAESGCGSESDHSGAAPLLASGVVARSLQTAGDAAPGHDSQNASDADAGSGDPAYNAGKPVPAGRVPPCGAAPTGRKKSGNVLAGMHVARASSETKIHCRAWIAIISVLSAQISVSAVLGTLICADKTLIKNVIAGTGKIKIPLCAAAP